MSDAAAPPCVLVSCTCGTRAEAERIAAALVERRLAACVQVAAVESWYRWQGAVEQAAEWRLQAKTAAARLPELEACVRALNGYDLPEIVAVAIAGGSADYLPWVAAETTGG